MKFGGRRLWSTGAQNFTFVRRLTKGSFHCQMEGAIVQSKEPAPSSSHWNNAEPFESIPGPKPLPIPFGNIWRFLPGGPYYNLNSDKLYDKLFNEFGPIVRLTGLTREDVIMIFSPEDAEIMFRNDTSTPIRRSFHCLNIYRNEMRKELFGGYQGLVSSDGEEWLHFRRTVNQPMVQPRSAALYIEPVVGVAEDFIERMKKLRDDKLEMPDNFLHEVNKWALESVTVIALDTRFGCLRDNLDGDSDALRLIEGVKTMFESLYVLEMKISPWRYIWTPAWGKFVKSMDILSEITLKHINSKWMAIKERGSNTGSNPSVLEDILTRSENHHVAFTMAMDMLIAGVDTTSSLLSNCLYHLSKNPEKQEILYRELKTIMPTKDHMLTYTDLNNAKYMKACVKETHRLSPVVLGTQRESAKDMVLSNYRIPKGTRLVCNNLKMCQLEQYFKEPSKFIPERWLKSEKDSEYNAKKTKAFVYLPFGFGPRTCIGRRFADLELHVMLSKIIRNFKISYDHGEMTWRSEILNIPEKALKFRVEDRKE